MFANCTGTEFIVVGRRWPTRETEAARRFGKGTSTTDFESKSVTTRHFPPFADHHYDDLVRGIADHDPALVIVVLGIFVAASWHCNVCPACASRRSSHRPWFAQARAHSKMPRAHRGRLRSPDPAARERRDRCDPDQLPTGAAGLPARLAGRHPRAGNAVAWAPVCRAEIEIPRHDGRPTSRREGAFLSTFGDWRTRALGLGAAPLQPHPRQTRTRDRQICNPRIHHTGSVLCMRSVV